MPPSHEAQEYKSPRKYCLLSRGRYGGMSISFIAMMANEPRWRTVVAIKEFFSDPKYAGREDEPACVGEFLVEYINDRRYQSALNSQSI
jgi:hypothetical protein